MAVCSAIRCGANAQPEHSPCCSAHGRDLCCHHYNRRHFVAANQCTPDSHAAPAAPARKDS